MGIQGADVFLLPPRLMKSIPVNSTLYSRGSSSCWRPLGMEQNSAPPLLKHRWSSGWGRARAPLQTPTPWQCCRPQLTPPVLTHVHPRNPSSESFCPINRGQWWVYSCSVTGSTNCHYKFLYGRGRKSVHPSILRPILVAAIKGVGWEGSAIIIQYESGL